MKKLGLLELIFCTKKSSKKSNRFQSVTLNYFLVTRWASPHSQHEQNKQTIKVTELPVSPFFGGLSRRWRQSVWIFKSIPNRPIKRPPLPEDTPSYSRRVCVMTLTKRLCSFLGLSVLVRRRRQVLRMLRNDVLMCVWWHRAAAVCGLAPVPGSSSRTS